MRDDPGAADGEGVLHDALHRFHHAFGRRLLAAYALGSLAHGGFSALVSDVDLGIVLADPRVLSDEAELRSVVELVRSEGSALHERLSLFWGTPSTLAGHATGGRFPPFDRLDLLEHGRLLFGSDMRECVARPNTTELMVVGAEFALDVLGGRQAATAPLPELGSAPSEGDAVEEVRQPELLVSHGPRRLTKIVLFPVRLMYSAASGRVGTNEDAVHHYVSDPRTPSKNLATAALRWRVVAPHNSAEATALLEAELMSLYVHFIDDHVARVVRAGRLDLAAGLEAWRARLVA
jgi:hypothetical protein